MMTHLLPFMNFEDVPFDFVPDGLLYSISTRKPKTRHLIQSLQKCFSDPKQLRPDGGPQFTSRQLRIIIENVGVLQLIKKAFHWKKLALNETKSKKTTHVIKFAINIVKSNWGAPFPFLKIFSDLSISIFWVKKRRALQ